MELTADGKRQFRRTSGYNIVSCGRQPRNTCSAAGPGQRTCTQSEGRTDRHAHRAKNTHMERREDRQIRIMKDRHTHTHTESKEQTDTAKDRHSKGVRTQTHTQGAKDGQIDTYSEGQTDTHTERKTGTHGDNRVENTTLESEAGSKGQERRGAF